MISVQELFFKEKADLSKLLEADQHVRASIQAVQSCFDRMKQDYIAGQDDVRLRQEASALFSVARRTFSACEAVQKTRLMQNLSPFAHSANASQKISWPQALLLFLPGVLCIAVWMTAFFTRQNSFALILSGAGVAGSLYQTYRLWMQGKKYRTPLRAEVQAEILVDTAALLTAVAMVCAEMDTLLNQSKQRANTIATAATFTWSKAQFASVQVLWEALQSKDGAYALSEVPSLLNQLENQGVQIKRYSPETADFFDTVPAEMDGITARPALLSNGAVIARGVVTASTIKGSPDAAE